jgi:hypothetical protein
MGFFHAQLYFPLPRPYLIGIFIMTDVSVSVTRNQSRLITIAECYDNCTQPLIERTVCGAAIV